MIVVYSTLTNKQLKKSVTETIAQIEDWFKKNPKRKICKASLWYDKMVKIRRDHVKEDVEAQAAITDTVEKKRAKG